MENRYMKIKSLFTCLVLFSVLFSMPVFAAGPLKVAKIDRSLWPFSVNTKEAFDFASEMEILAFLEQFVKVEKIDNEKALRKYTGLKKVSLDSVRKWRENTWKILRKNLNYSLLSKPDRLNILKSPATRDVISKSVSGLNGKIPENQKSWYRSASIFYEYYVYEQVRLASLFPRITSEIMVLDDTEIQGFERDDKSFLLTFDDGPSKKDGTTDNLIKLLRKEKIEGVFFVLGSSLKRRLKKGSEDELRALYEGMILGSHGYIHKPHGKFNGWDKSLKNTATLIRNIRKDHKELLFRPPYGQRTVEVISYAKDDNERVTLWNIDSQDWNRKITAEETADRVISLMLLWRSGIILYHDVYSKAELAVPAIVEYFKGAGLKYN